MKTFKGTVLFTGKKQCRVKANSADEAKEKVQELLDSSDFLEVYPDEMKVVETRVQELDDDDLDTAYLEECERCISDMIDCLEALLSKYEEGC